MCQSMVNIQSPTAEIRRGKKKKEERRRKKKQDENIYMVSLFHRATIKKDLSAPPQFSVHFYCGQTAGCIKMPIGMEVGLSPVDFVSDGYPAP